MNCKDLYIFGIYDGHGMNGKKASQFVKTRLPQNLEKAAQQFIGEGADEKTVSDFFTSNEN